MERRMFLCELGARIHCIDKGLNALVKISWPTSDPVHIFDETPYPFDERVNLRTDIGVRQLDG